MTQKDVPIIWTRGQLKQFHGAKTERQSGWKAEMWLDSKPCLSDSLKAATVERETYMSEGCHIERHRGNPDRKMT